MDIRIEKLDKNLSNDFFRYFDDIAFVDHKEWSWCYCTYFHCDEKTREGWAEKEDGHNQSRNYAKKLIENEEMQGYLAYQNNNIVGWCNTNDKINFSGLTARKELWNEDEKGIKIKSIVCFLIAPEMRGKGVATKILERICDDAKSEGYKYLEAYPHHNEKTVYMNYFGYYSMYEKKGFRVVKQFEHDCIVRKEL